MGDTWQQMLPSGGNNGQQQQQQVNPQLPSDSWRQFSRDSITNQGQLQQEEQPRRDYDRRERYRDGRSRSRSRSRERRRRSPDRRRSRSRDRYRKRSPPNDRSSKKVFLTQLPSNITNDQLTLIFAKQGFVPNEIKIFDKLDRGSVRTMGVVEFVDSSTTKQWMDVNQNSLTLPDGGKCAVEVITRSCDYYFDKKDWQCVMCNRNNYEGRDVCFGCAHSRTESINRERQGFSDIGGTACDTLLVRDLPPHINECHIRDVLRRTTKDYLRFKDVKMAESRSFAWIQMFSVADAELLLNTFNKAPLQINGSIVVTTFSRRSLSTIIAPVSITERPSTTINQQQISQQQIPLPSVNAPGYPAYGIPQSTPLPSGTLPMNTSHPPPSTHLPTFNQPPPNMMPQQQHQPHQSMVGMYGHSGMVQSMNGIPNLSMPPPTAAPTTNMHQPTPNMSFNTSLPHPGMMPQPQQPGMTMTMPGHAHSMPIGSAHPVMGTVPPVNDQAALLQAQLNAMKEQEAVIQKMQAQLQQISQVPPTVAPHQSAPPPVAATGTVNTPVGVLQVYDEPNPQTFIPEKTTDYMYDPVTTFYYDPISTYYFNSTLNKWMYYDTHYRTYIPVDQREHVQVALMTGTAPPMTVTPTAQVESTPKPDEKKTPAEIAKEMAKWAKKQEKSSTKVQMSLKPLVKQLETKSAFGSGIVAAISNPSENSSTVGGGGGYGSEVTMKMLDRAKNPLAHVNSDSEDEEMMGRRPDKTMTSSDIQEERGGPVQQIPQPEIKMKSSAEYREAMEAQLIDRIGKTCNLCKRAFASVDVLEKHVAKSDLHKKNLEEKRVEWGKAYVASVMAVSDGNGPINNGGSGDIHISSTPSTSSSSYSTPSTQSSYQYRDRAKERRNIHGIDAITAEYGSSSSSSSSSSRIGRPSDVTHLARESDAIASRPIDSSNIGNKLLQKMGWQEGSGVGKNLQGIVNPISAERRVEGTGLGLVGSKIAGGVNASHQDRTKAALYSRYTDLR